MEFNSFIEALKNRLQLPLPGEAAQFIMAPIGRLTSKEYQELGKNNPMHSAVLCCLYPSGGKIYLPLMMRPKEQGIHSGQVSFPGGKFEEADEQFERTALREAHEEVGIQQESVHLLSALTSVYIPVSNFMIHPFLAYASLRPDFKLNVEEAKGLLEVSVEDLMNKHLRGKGVFNSGIRSEIQAPYYSFGDQQVWGATAMILSEMEQILRDLL